MNNKDIPGLLSRLLERNFVQVQSGLSQWVTILLCAAVFVMLTFGDLYLSKFRDIGVILSQLQVLISIYLTIRVKKWGYLTSVLLNLLLILIYGFSVTSSPGILVQFSTIIIISIIYLFIVNYHRKIEEVTIQNDKLAILNNNLVKSNEELDNAHHELEQQHHLLQEYNQIIKNNQEELSRLAFHDMLTELPNRKMLISHLDQLITGAEKLYPNFAVAFIDLDDFKQVNDTYGHHIGDLLLQTVAEKLKSAIHQDDILGRLGGDEFALIIKRQLSKEELYAYIEMLRNLLMDDLMIENAPLPVRASFGLSRYPENGSTSSELLKSADTAMYAAKVRKESGIKFFDPDNLKNISKAHYSTYFNLGLENNEFYLVFQPQFLPDSGQLRGFEVLTRWHSAELGEVSPAEFFPIARKNGLMNLFGQWIITEACDKYQKFQKISPHPLTMSINISRAELLDPSFVLMVRHILEKTGVSGNNLEFEVSETTFLSVMNQTKGVFDDLQQLGIHIALDDFGKALTYVNNLRRYPFDTIKIDKSYIDAIDENKRSDYSVAALISMGHQMELTVLAKGVETPTQLAYLKTQACDWVQGYLCSKPLNEEDFCDFLAKQN
jgi:diguanylate cyclase (GGDEF)-like protein